MVRRTVFNPALWAQSAHAQLLDDVASGSYQKYSRSFSRTVRRLSTLSCE